MLGTVMNDRKCYEFREVGGFSRKLVDVRTR